MVAVARKTLLYEWRRFLPAIVSVAFAGLLQLLQAALVMGIFGSASIYVTGSSADLWVGYPGTQSVNEGRDIDPNLEVLLWMEPAVHQVERFHWVDGEWRTAGSEAGGVSVYVCGINPEPNGLMFARVLAPSLRARLTEPDAVVVDRADLDKLDARVGSRASINGRQVRIVGAAQGLRALGGVNVIASLDTARRLDPDISSANRPTYFLARLADSSRAAKVATRLRHQHGFGPYQVWTATAFAQRSVMFWLFDTGAGIGVLFMAAIVFLVGAVVTSQALMAAVVGSVREYATLNALGVGIPALRRIVLEQAFWVGTLGVVAAGLFGALLLSLARSQDVPVVLDVPIALACAVLIMLLATVSGLIAMRTLKRADPASLLR
mgnify:CR=1 FL=1